MKPKLKLSQILSMSMGFLGIQFGFALQNSNASRILQTFGADIEHLSWFWLAAPLTGLIIQPLIGHYSDRTWTRLGRRRPFFLTGALIASIALVLMPNAGMFTGYIPAMFVGAGFLMLMDASINVAMEPFRALVADMLPDEQSTLGFSVQTFLIGVGAVVGSWLPYILAEWFGISKTAIAGEIPDNVSFSFYIGALVFIASIVWTVVSTREYSPEELQAYENAKAEQTEMKSNKIPDNDFPAQSKSISRKSGVAEIFHNFIHMPGMMWQLSVVQFFTWTALFGMWVFTTPAIAQHVYGLSLNDVSSEKYQDAGNWVGIIFGVYNGVAMIYALLLPTLARKIGKKYTHSISLIAGALGLLSVWFIHDPNWLIFSMVGVGLAWGSILAIPYALLAPSLPQGKIGVYMGLFNIFITIPQILNGIFGGPLVKRVFDSQAIYALLISGVFLLIAALAVSLIREPVPDKP